MDIPFIGNLFLIEHFGHSSKLSVSGSGITLYAAHDLEFVHVSVTLDGNANSASITSIDPKSSGPVEYNVSIYDIQSLSSGNHHITVQLLPGPGNPQLWFDFAAVNDTQPSASPSPSATSGPSHSQ